MEYTTTLKSKVEVYSITKGEQAPICMVQIVNGKAVGYFSENRLKEDVVDSICAYLQKSSICDGVHIPFIYLTSIVPGSDAAERY